MGLGTQFTPRRRWSIDGLTWTQRQHCQRFVPSGVDELSYCVGLLDVDRRLVHTKVNGHQGRGTKYDRCPYLLVRCHHRR